MALLDDLIQEGISNDVPLQVLLRKALFLASEIKNDRLKEWASGELNGFSDSTTLPPYREIGAPAVGMLLGVAQAISDNPIPPSLLDEQHRHFATTVRIRQGIAALESLLETSQANGFLSIDWPGDLIAIYQTRIARGYSLNRAHQKIPRSAIVGICDTVRNRLLELAIELRGEIGREAWPPVGAAKQSVERSVTNIIYGGQNVIASQVGGAVVQAADHAVIKGDFSSLTAGLKDAGASEAEIEELKVAVEMDKATEGGFGPAVREWLSKLGKRVLGAAGSVAAAAVTAVATSMLKTYLGLP